MDMAKHTWFVTTHVVRLKVFILKTEGKKELKIFFQEERSYNNIISD